MCGLACLYLSWFLRNRVHRFRGKASIPCIYIDITALASATGGTSTPPPPGGEAPGRRRAKPSDSVEQGAKLPVRGKFGERVLKETFSRLLKTCQRCYTRYEEN